MSITRHRLYVVEDTVLGLDAYGLDWQNYSFDVYHTTIFTFDSLDKARDCAKTCARYFNRPFAVKNEFWDECEHGLSASLCAGPGHYPSDHMY